MQKHFELFDNATGKKNICKSLSIDIYQKFLKQKESHFRVHQQKFFRRDEESKAYAHRKSRYAYDQYDDKQLCVHPSMYAAQF